VPAANRGDSEGREAQVFAMRDELLHCAPTEVQRRRARQSGVCIPGETRKIARKVLTRSHGFL
jgi:hypothetical protein